MTTPYEFCKAGATLGECPIWYEGDLWWIDIESGSIHSTCDGIEFSTVQVGGRVGSICPTGVQGRWLVAGQNGFHFLDVQDRVFSKIVDPEEDAVGNRFNDGKCDPWGNFVAGTMSIDGQGTAGSLYRLSTTGQVCTLLNGVGISNGLAWSKNGEILYYIDTSTRRVERFNYHPSKPLTNRQVVTEFSEGHGVPDGMCIDTRGFLWVALWGGGAVVCIDPETGLEVDRLLISAAHVTSCAFGGQHLDVLYVTTASDTPDQLGSSQGVSGSVFAADVGVIGVPTVKYGGGL